VAGVQQGAKQVTFNGMDGPVLDKTPDFLKALDLDHARDGEVMLAYGIADFVCLARGDRGFQTRTQSRPGEEQLYRLPLR
jgi:hypothetical protein